MNLTQDEREEMDERDYRESVQEEIEDKKHASGISIDELSLMDARADGRRAGHLGLSAGLNPYDPSFPEHQAWEEGRTCVIGMWLNSGLKRA